MQSPIYLNGSTHVARRRLESTAASEIYLTATPSAGADLQTGARHLYTAIRDEVTSASGRILSERLFATAECVPIIEKIRSEIYGELDDGVAPTRVVVSPSPGAPFVGAQVHAVRSAGRTSVLRCWEDSRATSARLFTCGEDTWLFVNGMNGGAVLDEPEAARRMFCCTGCFLNQAGGSMKSVARTWLWLKDVCGWYDDLNAARTSFFKRAGLVDEENRKARLPASTGIGLHAPDGAPCTLDLVALPGREAQIELVAGGGDQRSAFEYGSAFSRAAVAPMPGGKTVFISGTAAIDSAGHTEHVGQVAAQIDATIAHVRSLLADLGCGDEHVLTSLVYCKDAGVEQEFRARWADLAWPRLIMIGDVCRPDLLFEVEVTASPEIAPVSG